MSFLDKNLLENERILYRTKKHWIVFFPPVFWGVVTIIMFFLSNPILHKIVFLPALLALIFLVNTLLIYYFSEFAITNIRIVMREGLIFRHTNDTRLSAIANIALVQGVVAQVLDYGNLVINSFGGDSDTFTEITTPVKFKNILQEQLYLQQNRKY